MRRMTLAAMAVAGQEHTGDHSQDWDMQVGQDSAGQGERCQDRDTQADRDSAGQGEHCQSWDCPGRDTEADRDSAGEEYSP